MTTYSILIGDIPVLPADEQYIRYIDQTSPMVFGDGFEDGDTPYFKGPASNTWFRCKKLIG
jgi:hypothetical protein